MIVRQTIIRAVFISVLILGPIGTAAITLAAPPTKNKFQAGDRVVATADLHVRAGPTTKRGGDIIAVARAGTVGTIGRGPTSDKHYTWYEVIFDGFQVGWSVQDYMTLVNQFPPPPPAPAALPVPPPSPAPTPGPVPPGSKFVTGDQVVAAADLHVRAGPTTKRGGDIIALAPAGTVGTIGRGPISDKHYTWYEVTFNEFPIGWSDQDYLTLSLPLPPPFAPSAAVPIPELALWESQMITYGQQACDYLARTDLTLDDRLAHTYYDQLRVMHQIADYTGQASWADCALRARAVYRDQYVIPNGGSVPGYWNFTTGLRMDYAHTASPESQTAVLLLAEKAAYAADHTPLEWTQGTGLSREVAYAILSYINAEALGAPPRPRRLELVNQAYNHMSQWFVTFAWQGTTNQFSPFLVALTAESLIRDWEKTADPRLIPILKLATDYLWIEAWVAENQAMRYQLNPSSPEGGGRSTTGSPDLNLLIAPMYAFLYWQTGDTKYRDRGDMLFAGGAKGAYLVGGKQFNQNYGWGFAYIAWRMPAPSPGPASVPPPSGNTYTNPIINAYLADPYILSVGDTYYLYATEAGTTPNGRKMPIYRSQNLVDWQFVRGAVIQGPPGSWNQKNFWAPEVMYYNGLYYFYYTASTLTKDNSGNRIGVAVSPSPEGPFEDWGVVVPYPSLDQHFFRDDDGRMYMYFTTEGGGDIYVDRMLSPTQLAGSPVLLRDYSWSEGTAMLKRNGTYYFMFSVGKWHTGNYHVQWATGPSPMGPFTYQGVLLSSAAEVQGPGHHALFVGPDGQDWIVYHAWDVNFTARYPRIDRFFVGPQGISTNGPTVTPQPLP